MARITIVAEDNLVGVDSVFRTVDLTGLDSNIHAVQWFNTVGEIEYIDRRAETEITDFTPYQSFVDLWTAAEPPAPTLSELKDQKKFDFKVETVVRMSAQVSAWNDFETIEFLLSISNLLDAGAMTAAQILAKDILLYTKNTAFAKVAAAANKTALALIDPTLADPFGDGTPWPT